MRDPDLVLRAQRAAATLERAWDRWRTMHGLGAGPLPPVSSYVGYSLEEPWGQPRVVFGVAAEEAEQMAALLDQQCYAGPGYAAEPARVRVPAQGPARPEEDARFAPREASAELAARPASADREAAVPLPAPTAMPVPPGPAGAAGPSQGGQPAAEPGGERSSGLIAFQPNHEPAGYEAGGPAGEAQYRDGVAGADDASAAEDHGASDDRARAAGITSPGGTPPGGSVPGSQQPGSGRPGAGRPDGGERPAAADADSAEAAPAQPAAAGVPRSGARPVRAESRKSRQARAGVGQRGSDAVPDGR